MADGFSIDSGRAAIGAEIPDAICGYAQIKNTSVD